MTPEEFRSLLATYSAQMVAEIVALWSHASTMSTAEFTAWMVTAYPQTVDPHIALAADLAAVWYDEAAPDLSFTATAAELPPVEQLQKSVNWAFNYPGAQELLSGSAERMFFNGARETIVQSSKAEQGSSWAREAKPDACRWCQMLSTRGAVYSTEALATHHGTGKRRSSNGIKPPTHNDDGYHDNCHCIAVPVRPGQSYQPPVYADGWTADYNRARKLAPGITPQDIMKGYRHLDSQ